MEKRIAILQSNYIPWKGYFDIINKADDFVFYDDVQYTKRDWRNRNQIKTPNGLQWITIPVNQKSFYQKISEIEVAHDYWSKKHWKSISLNYSKSPYFLDYKNVFEEFYMRTKLTRLSEINYRCIEIIVHLLNIKTRFHFSDQLNPQGNPSEKLLDVVKKLNGTVYISGPSAKAYLDEKIFLDNNIRIEWMDYSNYPTYQQLYPPFNHNVSILDLIFNEGDAAIKFMKTF